SRRKFLKIAGTAALGGALAACAPAVAPTAVPPTAAPQPTAAAAPTVAAPTVASNRTVRVAILASNAQGLQDILAKTNFTKQTGINVEIVNRTDTKETELARLASAVQAGTSPYDLIDFEDELTTSFSQAGYMVGLDSLLPSDFWDDFSPGMVAYSKQW